MAQDESMLIQAGSEDGAEDDDADATVAEDADSVALQKNFWTAKEEGAENQQY